MNQIIETLMSRTLQEFPYLARGKYGPVALDPGIVQNVLRKGKEKKAVRGWDIHPGSLAGRDWEVLWAIQSG